jgi:hypothetical protein
MADIYIEYLPPTDNKTFDLKAQALIDLLRTYISEHDTSLTTLEAALAWTTVSSFSNSWVNFGSPAEAVGYTKTTSGFVFLRGMLKDGSVGDTAFTLPAGYRPAGQKYYGVLSNADIGRVDIETDGDVIPKTPSNNAYVSLDNIFFYAG